MRSSEKINLILNGQSETETENPPRCRPSTSLLLAWRYYKIEDVSHLLMNANGRKQTKLGSCLWRKHSASALGVTRQLNVNACQTWSSLTSRSSNDNVMEESQRSLKEHHTTRGMWYIHICLDSIPASSILFIPQKHACLLLISQNYPKLAASPATWNLLCPQHPRPFSQQLMVAL